MELWPSRSLSFCPGLQGQVPENKEQPFHPEPIEIIQTSLS